MNEKSNDVFVHFGCSGGSQAFSSGETLLDAGIGFLSGLKGEVTERVNALVEMLEGDSGSEAVLTEAEVKHLQSEVTHLRAIGSALALILTNPLVTNATKSHLAVGLAAGQSAVAGPCSRRAREELADMMSVIARLQRDRRSAA